MIKDLFDGQNANGVYLVRNVTKGVTNNNLTYLSVTLQDKTGTIEAKKWEVSVSDNENIKIGKIIKITGDAYLYKEKMQIKIFTAESVDENDASVESLLVEGPRPLEELIQQFNFFKESIKDVDCKKILNNIFNKYYDSFIKYPAAMTNHHEFYHGLIAHTVSMCEVATMMASHYTDINKDLLLTGCLLHDIGKVVEFTGVVATKYTVEGNLLGHISIGMSFINEAAKEEGITSETPMLLKHMILAHHGKHEFGSPVLPLTKEALLLSMIDEMDSKMATIDKAMKDLEPGTFTDRIFSIDNRTFYKPKK